MGFLSNIVSKAAKKVVPKILVGGTKADREAVQKVVAQDRPEVNAVFDKFGKSVETGVKIAGVIAGTALTAGLLAPAAGAAGVGSAAAGGTAAVGGASPILKSLIPSTTSKSVGLIDTITKGINKVTAFSHTEFGKNLIGTAGKLVSNLGTPAAAKPSTVAQQVALAAGTVQNVAETISQAAVFQGKGVSVKLGEDATADTWWNRNKSWALPVALAVPGFFMLLFMLFGGRRR